MGLPSDKPKPDIPKDKVLPPPAPKGKSKEGDMTKDLALRVIIHHLCLTSGEEPQKDIVLLAHIDGNFNRSEWTYKGLCDFLTK